MCSVETDAELWKPRLGDHSRSAHCPLPDVPQIPGRPGQRETDRPPNRGFLNVTLAS